MIQLSEERKVIRSGRFLVYIRNQDVGLPKPASVNRESAGAALLSVGNFGVAGSLSNTMSPGTRPTSVVRIKWHPDPSNRLITKHQRYRQERQDNGPVVDGYF